MSQKNENLQIRELKERILQLNNENIQIRESKEQILYQRDLKVRKRKIYIPF